MAALKIVRWCLVCPSALMTLLITGCASRGGVDNDSYVSNGAQDYPVSIVAASFAPVGDIEVAKVGYTLLPHGCLPVTIEVKAWTPGKVDGALQGAGRGALECGLASIGAGPYFSFIFVPCAVHTVPVMAVVGAWDAAPTAEVEVVTHSSPERLKSATQDAFAERGHAYLAPMSQQPVNLVPVAETADSDDTTERPEYLPQPKASGTVLELGLREIRLTGSGKRNAPLCLHMVAHWRKRDSRSGGLIYEFEHARIIECHAAGDRLKEDGVLLSTALDNGQ